MAGANDLFKSEKQHESYGMLYFGRTYGNQGRPLFGSSLLHNDTIVMRVSTAILERGLNTDWFHADKNLIEIEMSQSQFAEAITSLNNGDGVPVTLRRVMGKPMEECPYENKVELHRQEFKEINRECNKNINNAIEELRTLFATKKNLTKSDKESIMSKLDALKRDMNQNAEYQVTMFGEQMDKTIKEAKGEIEAFFTRKVHSLAGLPLEHMDNPISLEQTENAKLTE